MPKVKAYGQYCPVAKSLDVVGDRWTLLIIRDLMRGKQRFKDLQESLMGIAPNLLSDRLKKLEEAGLVVRTMFRQIPPRVEYALTDKGRGLDSVLASLARFGMQHLMARPSKGEVVDPELIFQAMPAVFIPSAAKGVDAVYRIDLDGKLGGTWFVDVSSKRCRVTQQKSREPKVTIATDVHTWAQIATGLMEPDDAMQQGLLTATGDLKLADRFASFFRRPTASEEEKTSPGTRGSRTAV